MPNKKAMELSINFIVILIISLVIFGFGVRFIYNLFGHAKDITTLTFEEIDQRIGNLICEGYDRVCIPTEKETINRKDGKIFGVKILNVLTPPAGQTGQDFEVYVSPPADYLGYRKHTTIEITPTGDFSGLIVNPPTRQTNPSRTVFIKQNEERPVGIGIQVPANAVSGTYILNVEIKTKIRQPDGAYKDDFYSLIQKLYVDVP